MAASVAFMVLSLLALACGGSSDTNIGPKAASTHSPSLELPKDLPVYQEARLMNVFATAQGGISATWETDAAISGVTAFYRGALDRVPWTITEIQSSPNLQGQGIIISFRRHNDPNTSGILTTSVFPRQPPAVGYKTIISLTYRASAQASPTAPP